MDLVVLQWITICMRVVRTEDSIVTNFLAVTFMLNSCITISTLETFGETFVAHVAVKFRESFCRRVLSNVADKLLTLELHFIEYNYDI